jgi:hypothetical protein
VAGITNHILNLELIYLVIDVFSNLAVKLSQEAMSALVTGIARAGVGSVV